MIPDRGPGADPGRPAAFSSAAAPPVISVDLRGGTDGSRLGTVRAALEQIRWTDTPRFLVVDETRQLVGHQLLYEQLFSYGPAQIVCLAVGAGDGHTLSRTAVLRPPETGVLWISDVLAGGAQSPGDSLRPLLELLGEPEVFDAVLAGLASVPHATAVPAARVVEHDLTPEAASRSWRQALDGLIGEDMAMPTLVTEAVPGAGDDAVPSELAPLLGESVPRGLAQRNWLRPDGPAAAQHRECDEALRDAADGYVRVRGAAGLFGTVRREVDLPGDLERLSAGLTAYRDTIAGALTDAGGDRLRPEQRSQLLKRGIALPEATEVAEASRATVGPALRRYAEQLLARRLPLRSVAARLSAVAGRSAPAGGAVLLARLDEVCPQRTVTALAVPVPFAIGGGFVVEVVGAALVSALAGLWPGLGWGLGPLMGLAVAALAVLMVRRAPNRSFDGRLDGGGHARTGPRLLAGLAGGLLGAFAGQLLAPPTWVGALSLLVALAAGALWSVWDWTMAVDDWWARTDADFGARAVAGLDELLAETAVQDWVFADARRHCSDGARAVAVLVRSLADTAEERLKDRTHTGGPAGRAKSAGRPATAGPDTPWGPAPGAVPDQSESESRSLADTWSWDSWGDSAADDDWAGLGRPAGGPRQQEGHIGTESAQPQPAEEPPVSAPYEEVSPVEEVYAHPGTGVRPEADPPWLERERGNGGAGLVETLIGDLAHGVTLIIATHWASLERDPSAVARLPVRAPMDALLDEENARLLRDGAAAPPPFAPDIQLRPGAAELLGVSADRVIQLLDAERVADHTVPLCSAQYRRLLSKGPTAYHQVRFAPEAMRRGIEAETAEDGWHGEGTMGVVWTASGRHAGVLRLVPLRDGTVRVVRGQEGTTP